MILLHHIEKYAHPGLWRDAFCRLSIYQDGEGFVVVASDHPENPGASVTNTIEKIATQVCREFPGIPADKDGEAVTWLEHYPANQVRGERWAKVTFKSRTDKEGFRTPQWQHMSEEEASWLLGR